MLSRDRDELCTVSVAKFIFSQEKNGVYNFEKFDHYKAKGDLRNPANQNIKNEIFIAFGLNPTKNYIDNCKITDTQKTTNVIKQIPN